ncbi:MAG: hypothetical protein KKC19_01330 [Nanoarchaeota archaeon]|nr:hypothetical protein [Nanoarchaeota archaeon]
MKKWVVFVLLLLILPLASAETMILLNQQPKSVYNLGDKLNIPITVTSNQGVYDFLRVSLMCDSRTHNFPEDSIDLAPGEAKKIDNSVLLINRFVGSVIGTCKIRVGLENDVENYIFSNEFRISNIINLNVKLDKASYSPGDTIVVNVDSSKEDGKLVSGIFELKLTDELGTDVVSQGGVILNGILSTEIQIQNDTKAGSYTVSLNVRESDPLGEITNVGSSFAGFSVDQVPRNLEVVFESESVEPGTDLRVKAILRDQTGENIESVTSVKIKNKDGKIVSQSEVQTGEFYNLPIAYNEVPSAWTAVFESNGIFNEMNFTISEKVDLGIEILDRTLILTNTGNVPYNDTAVVKVGEETLYLDVYLNLDEEKRYRLEAPDGEYVVEVLAGERSMTGNFALTGKSIDVSEASGGGFAKYSFVWLFIILILGFVFVIAYRRGYQRNFVGYVSSRMSRKSNISTSLMSGKEVHSGATSLNSSHVLGDSFKDLIVNPKSNAELSLSMQGNKQDVCIVVLNVKNAENVVSGKGNAKETLQQIVDVADENRASTYRGNSSLFFILAPERTKTFGNEGVALEIAKKTKEILANHNKMFQQKISFGISINNGPMIVKSDGANLQFMSLGNLMMNSKKISTFAEDDVLLSEKVNDKLRSIVKAERHEKNGIPVYSIKEIRKNSDSSKNFIKNFLEKNFDGEEGKKS